MGRKKNKTEIGPKLIWFLFFILPQMVYVNKKIVIPEYAELSLEFYRNYFVVKPMTYWIRHSEYLHSGLDTQSRELKVNFLSLQMFSVHQATGEGKSLFQIPSFTKSRHIFCMKI